LKQHERIENVNDAVAQDINPQRSAWLRRQKTPLGKSPQRRFCFIEPCAEKDPFGLAESRWLIADSPHRWGALAAQPSIERVPTKTRSKQTKDESS